MSIARPCVCVRSRTVKIEANVVASNFTVCYRVSVVTYELLRDYLLYLVLRSVLTRKTPPLDTALVLGLHLVYLCFP